MMEILHTSVRSTEMLPFSVLFLSYLILSLFINPIIINISTGAIDANK